MLGSNKNTSQDPEYVGPTGHEKRPIHHTHFTVPELPWKKEVKKTKKKKNK